MKETLIGIAQQYPPAGWILGILVILLYAHEIQQSYSIEGIKGFNAYYLGFLINNLMFSIVTTSYLMGGSPEIMGGIEIQTYIQMLGFYCMLLQTVFFIWIGVRKAQRILVPMHPEPLARARITYLLVIQHAVIGYLLVGVQVFLYK